MTTVNSKVWTIEEIRNKITTDKVWTTRAILSLYDRQTLDEQVALETRDRNNIGFNGLDARFMSSLAEWVNSGRSLSVRQTQIAQRKIAKYAGQLTRIANGEA